MAEPAWDPEVDGDLDAPAPPPPEHKPRVEHQSSYAGHRTPEPILNLVRLHGPIVLDPATTRDNPVKAEYIRTAECDPDGLDTSWWEFNGLVFVNPPYGRAYNRVWAKKIAFEGVQGAEIIALVAVRPGSRWWKSMWEADSICFIDHRIKFVGMPSGAPFDSALCYWGERAKRFDVTMQGLGKLIRP